MSTSWVELRWWNVISIVVSFQLCGNSSTETFTALIRPIIVVLLRSTIPPSERVTHCETEKSSPLSLWDDFSRSSLEHSQRSPLRDDILRQGVSVLTVLNDEDHLHSVYKIWREGRTHPISNRICGARGLHPSFILEMWKRLCIAIIYGPRLLSLLLLLIPYFSHDLNLRFERRIQDVTEREREISMSCSLHISQ